MRPILLAAKAVQAIENTATANPSIGLKYNDHAWQDLGLEAGPWAIAFLASHRWMADSAKEIYRRIEVRVKSLTVREGKDVAMDIEVETESEAIEEFNEALEDKIIETVIKLKKSEGNLR